MERLCALLNCLQKTPNEFQEFNKKVREQLEEGIVAMTPEVPTENECYMPYKAAFKEEVESTGLRVV